VLLHLREPLAALKEMRRVLKPDGVVGIVDGDAGNLVFAPPAPAVDKLWGFLHRSIQHHGRDPLALSVAPWIIRQELPRFRLYAWRLCVANKC
jgi:ubiquinone/menaquinone biosynthesis C-methylase UbiE